MGNEMVCVVNAISDSLVIELISEAITYRYHSVL